MRTLRGNMHGVQSDCPHREKFGYGGDLVADSEMALYLFDMAAFYRKVVRDFADAARPNGGFTETAPFRGYRGQRLWRRQRSNWLGHGAPVVAYAALPVLRRESACSKSNTPAAQRWMALLESQAVDGLIDNGIGDHESLVEKDTAVSGTGFYYFNACLMEGLAKILGRTGDAARYAALAESIGGEFNQRLYHPETGAYGLAVPGEPGHCASLGPGAGRPDCKDARCAADGHRRYAPRTPEHGDLRHQVHAANAQPAWPPRTWPAASWTSETSPAGDI